MMTKRVNYINNPDEELEKPFIFQITNIRSGDAEDDENDENKFYKIQIFGISKGGFTVHVNINDFTPFFYVEVPNNMNLPSFLNTIKDRVKNPDYVKMLIDSKCKIIEKKKLIGFTNGKKFRFIRLVFKNLEGMRKFSNIFIYPFMVFGITKKPYKFQIYESNIEPIMRFLHCRNIEPAGWVKLTNYIELKRKGNSLCHIYLQANFMDAIGIAESDNLGIAPIMCMAFDIECTSSDGGFPNPSKPRDEIIMICSIFRKYPDQTSCLKVVHCLKKCEKIRDNKTKVIECENEKKLLIAWRDLIQNMDPDYIYGYNSNGFDWSYIYQRANKLGCLTEFMRIGRNLNESAVWCEKTLSSSALGDNVHKFIDMSGRIIMDVMKEIQKDNKLDTYKLDNVAEHFLGSNKVDLSPKQLFENYNEKGTPEAIKEIAVYCIQDTELCNDLVWKLNIIIKAIKMANVCSVPAEYIFYRGQGVKIFSLVAKYCRLMDFLIPVIQKPRIKQGNNEDDKEFKKREDALKEEAKYQGAYVFNTEGGIYFMPIIVLDFNSLYPSCIRSFNISHDTIILEDQYDNIEGLVYEDITYQDFDGSTVKCRFVQTREDGSLQGVLPTILEILLNTRSDYKQKMKKCDPNSFEYTLLDSSQLAYKIVANSCYGQCGASTSPIYYKKLAACTTAKGRDMLMSAKDLGENSNFGLKCIYGDSVASYTPILVRSKLTAEVYIISIDSLDVGEWNSYEEFKAGDHGRTDKQWARSIYEVWTDKGWSNIRRVIKHKVAKKMYRVNTVHGLVDITEDHSLMTSDLKEIKPIDCTMETELLHSFPRNYADGRQYAKGEYIFTNQCEAMKMYYKLKTINTNIIISYKENTYILTVKDGENEISLSVKDIGYAEGFVYDLETECGRFHAGIGELIVKNTDSNFYLCTKIDEKLGKIEKISEAIRMGPIVAKYITEQLRRKHIILAYEKVYKPFFISTAKCYFGILYEFNPNHGYLKVMGMAVKRRNYCAFTKEINQMLMDRIADADKQEDIGDVVDIVKEKLEELATGKVPLEKLVITMGLRADYKVPPAHYYLAERMRARGETVNSNDRIQYTFPMHPPIYNTRGTPVKKQIKDIIEEYGYMKNQGLPYDPEIYIENQIKEPVSVIIRFLVKDPEEVFTEIIEKIRAIKIAKYGEPVKALTKAQKKKLGLPIDD